MTTNALQTQHFRKPQYKKEIGYVTFSDRYLLLLIMIMLYCNDSVSEGIFMKADWMEILSEVLITSKGPPRSTAPVSGANQFP